MLTMLYRVYSDKPTGKSKIHKETRHCFQNRKNTRKPDNWWHGPYDSIEMAESSPENIGTVSPCGHCFRQGRNSAKVRVTRRPAEVSTPPVLSATNQENSVNGADLKAGATYVTVTVRNMAEPDRTWNGLFRVDTGATDCMVPRQHLEAIGIMPRGKRLYELADGKPVSFDIAAAQVEFMGDFAGATIIFGDEDSEPLLGVTALESVGIEVDPRNQTLKRLPAVRLKGLRG